MSPHCRSQMRHNFYELVSWSTNSVPRLQRFDCVSQSFIVSVYLGKEWKRASETGRYSPVCSEGSHEHSVQPSRRCKSHLCCQTAQGFKFWWDPCTFSGFQVVLLFSEAIRMCFGFSADRLSPGWCLEGKWKIRHGRTDPKNRNYSTGCHLQQVCVY